MTLKKYIHILSSSFCYNSWLRLACRSKGLLGLEILQSASSLSYLDYIAIWVKHVTTDFQTMIFWLSKKFSSLSSPLLITGPDVSDTNNHEAAIFLQILRWMESYVWFVVSWPPAYIENDPAIGNLDNGWFSIANNFSSKNSKIVVSRSLYVSYSQEVS